MLKKVILLLSLSLALSAFDKGVSSGQIMGTSSCPICNMNIKKFYKSSHAVKHKDGKEEHFCSIVCLKKGKKAGDTIYVANSTTGKMIKVQSATYIIGSDVPSTMGAKNSKVAFGSKSDAKKFQKNHGGSLGNFDKALQSK